MEPGTLFYPGKGGTEPVNALLPTEGRDEADKSASPQGKMGWGAVTLCFPGKGGMEPLTPPRPPSPRAGRDGAGNPLLLKEGRDGAGRLPLSQGRAGWSQ